MSHRAVSVSSLDLRHAGVITLLLVLMPMFCGAGAESGYEPSTSVENGTELGFVYIGSTGCGFCRRPDLKQAVLRAKDLLAQRARAKGQHFYATGVATDFSLEQGIAFLRDVGPFDQIVVGRGEHNLAVLDFVSHDAGAHPGLPQIVVFEQEVQRTPTRLWAGPARLLCRVGGTQIVPWVAQGVPLDR